MNPTNAYKLSAIVAKWLEPMAGQLAGMRISSLPALANIESKIKSSGWVGGGYSIANDLSPIMGKVINAMIQPAVHGMVKDIPDDTIPQMARSIVDAAIENGGMSILDGRICFSSEDVVRLGNMLSRNLPVEDCGFVVEE